MRFPLEGLSVGLDSVGMYTIRGRKLQAKVCAAAALRVRLSALAELRPLVAAPTTTLASTRMGSFRWWFRCARAAHFNASR